MEMQIEREMWKIRLREIMVRIQFWGEKVRLNAKQR